ncbi:BTAD domain-containing putative transcriptional regulator [soil metagenome]
MVQAPLLQALGGLKLESTTFHQPKPLVLLAYLSIEGAQSRRHLAELFWPSGNRMKSLSMTLTRLRHGAGSIVAADEIRAWSTVPCDTASLLTALDAGDWQGAFDLYRGAFLDGVVLDGWGSELEEWVLTTREYLAERVQHAYLALAEAAAGREAFGEAADIAARAHRLPGVGAPEIETLRRLHVVLSAGGSARASDVLRELQEFGPEAPLSSQAARAALRSMRGTVPQDLVARATTFVGREVELAQLTELLERGAARLVTLLGPGGVGKSRLAQELARAESQALRYRDGVFVALLDSLTDPERLPFEILRAVGLTATAAGDPWETLANGLAERRLLVVLDDFEALVPAAYRLSALLRAAPGLDLVVTSRLRLGVEEEHLVPVTGLRTPPEGRISWVEAEEFEAVRLFAARARQLRPDVPLAEEVEHVVALCRWLQGLPLGLELASAWVRLLSCAEIASEIERDLDFLASTAPTVPERHRSVRAMLEVSWRLLSEREREAMRRLAVFRGGFRREAAEEVAGVTLRLLVRLVDASLLRVSSSGRFDRNPLLAQFVREQLERAPDELAESTSRHAAHMLAFAERIEPTLHGPEQVAGFARLAEEMENALTALAALEAAGDAERALRLTVALAHFWRTRGEGRRALDGLSRNLERTAGATPLRVQATRLAGDCAWRLGAHEDAERFYRACLALTGDGHHDDEHVEALLGLSSVYRANRGELGRARAYARRALDLARRRGTGMPLAHALRTTGTHLVDAADYAGAKEHYQESAEVAAACGDAVERARSNLSLATVLTYLGDDDRAGRLTRESLELFRKVGDRHGQAMALLNLGVNAPNVDGGRVTIRYYRASLEAYRALGDVRMVSHLLNNIAGLLQTVRRPRPALPLLEASLAIQRRIGDATLVSHALFILGQVLEDLGRRDDAYARFAECIDLCRANGEAWALMRALERLSRWHLRGGDRVAATEALDEAERVAARAGDLGTLKKVAETRALLSPA